MRHGLLVILVGVVACRAEPSRAATTDAAAGPAVAPRALGRPPVHVDSFVPLDEALRRFRRDSAPAAVSRLEPAAPSRDSLVRLFATAVARRDTVTLKAYALDAREFAWLYYEDSPLARPPYELDPQMMWFQLQQQSVKGRRRVVERLGGAPLAIVGHRCGEPRRQGASRVWERCVVRLREGGAPVERRLFGSIVERAGRWKFVGYGNDY
jgi:hypothetical protein